MPAAARHARALLVRDRDAPRKRRRQLPGEAEELPDLALHERRVQLRPAGRCDALGDRRDLGVEGVARALGEVRVAVPRDHAQVHGDPARKLLVAAREHVHERERIDVRHVQPPGEQLDERRARGRRDADRAVVADQGDPGRAVVETERVGADDRLVDPAVAALEDLAVLVDEEVVADVVPAVALHVVDVVPAHDRRRLGRRVVVRVDGVVDQDEAERGRVDGTLVAPDRLVGAPRLPRDDGRRARDAEPPRGDPLDRAPEEVRA